VQRLPLVGPRRLADQQAPGVAPEPVGDEGQQHPDEDRGARVEYRHPGELVQPDTGQRQEDADDGGAVLEQHGLHGGVVALLQMRPDRIAAGGCLAADLMGRLPP
jgi:hypothetical protein